MKTKLLLVGLIAVVMLMLSGCGSTADENKPMSEVKAEAETMSVEKLKAMAVAYNKAIAAKKPELDKLVAKLKEYSLTKGLGQEAETLTSEIEALNKSVRALKERFGVYYEKLKELKADVSDLTL